MSLKDIIAQRRQAMQSVQARRGGRLAAQSGVSSIWFRPPPRGPGRDFAPYPQKPFDWRPRHSYIRTYGTGHGPVGASVGLPFQPSSSAAGQDIKAKCSTGIEKLATVCELVDKDNETRRLLGADDILTSARKSIKEGDAALDQLSAAQTAQDLVASAVAVARVSPAGMEHGGANGHIAPALRTTADGGPRQTVF